MHFLDPDLPPAASPIAPEAAAHPSRSEGRSLLAIVLAAGKGTRMRSERPKVLHALAGRTMLAHVLSGAQAAGATRLAVVAEPGGPGTLSEAGVREDVLREVEAVAPGALVVPQAERLGTAHAVLAAREALSGGADDVIVAFGDTPLVTADTLRRLRAPLGRGAAVAILAFEAADPTGYGRLVAEGEAVRAIREEKDASATERRLTLCSAGLMALSGIHALPLLARIGNANAAGEYYLTDAVALAVADGLAVAVVRVAEDEAKGVNDRVQLAAAEAVMQARLRHAAMLAGATLVAPETVFLSADTVFGRDVVVEPHCVFGPGVTVGDGCIVRAFSHLERATLDEGMSVGPYARLPGGAP